MSNLTLSVTSADCSLADKLRQNCVSPTEMHVTSFQTNVTKGKKRFDEKQSEVEVNNSKLLALLEIT